MEQQTLVLPTTAKSLGFHGDFKNFVSFNIPSGVENVCFTGLKNLENINVSEGVKQFSIYECNKVTKLKLPYSTEEVWFGECENLATLNSDRAIENINIYSAYDCPNLKLDIYLHDIKDNPAACPDNDSEGPYRNSGITSVTIELGCFYYTTTVYKYVNGQMVPDGTTDVVAYEKSWFRGMKNLKEINVVNGKKFYSIDGVLYWSEDGKHKDEDDLLAYPAGKSTASNYTLPSWVKCMYYYALDSCKFTSVTILENASSNFYWDTSWIYEASVFTGCNAKLRVIKHSAGMSGYSTKGDLADELYINSNRIEYYKGSKYTITYKLNGGKNSSKNPKSYTAGDDTITLTNPTRKGYTFCGWKRNDVTSGFENTTERYRHFRIIPLQLFG